MASIELTVAESDALLEIAREAVTEAVRTGAAPRETAAPLTGVLAESGASFVTLYRNEALRGCVGSLSPVRPLGLDVMHNAYAAAFHDTRFPPVAAHELAALSVTVTLLGPTSSIAVTDEDALLCALRPGIDGLVLQGHGRRATFLPAVWKQLPAPRAFLRHLKHKAGFPPEFWSSELTFQRYETITLGNEPTAA